MGRWSCHHKRFMVHPVCDLWCPCSSPKVLRQHLTHLMLSSTSIPGPRRSGVNGSHLVPLSMSPTAREVPPGSILMWLSYTMLHDEHVQFSSTTSVFWTLYIINSHPYPSLSIRSIRSISFESLQKYTAQLQQWLNANPIKSHIRISASTPLHLVW